MKNNIQTGLTAEQAQNLLNQFGPNQITTRQEIKFWGIVKEEVTEPMILLLLVVGFFYSIWGKLEDAITIFVVILLLVLAEVWNEYRAKKAISALSKIAAVKTKVIRDGKITEINSEEIVPGDILVLSLGTIISADAKIIQDYSLQADESSLTGEALAVEKNIDDQIFANTLIVAGEGLAQVTVTGKATKFGQIAALAKTIKEPKTILQLAMKDLSKKLVWLALFFSISIPLFGILRGLDFKQMILTGLSLAFATIPEELPIIITMVLGLGAYQLSKKNFLVKKIKAAESLGNATVILTDKTGTITANKLKVVSIFPQQAEKEIIKSALAAITDMALNPIDQTILDYSQSIQLERDGDKIIKERSFENGRKTKTIFREINNTLQIFSSGAPEEIFKMCQGDKADWENELTNETAKGRRVIAIAHKILSSDEKNLGIPQLEKNLTLIGLISLEDSPRPGVKDTINQAKKAGIRTIIVSGDHPQTVAYIAKLVGIPADKILIGPEIDKLSVAELQDKVKNTSVFARTTPEHKYKLLKALQANGEIVAVTGDGVNDTLALKGADIGIAMGIKGTDAAKEAADIVLADDNYVTLTSGIFEGRKFFDNLSKGVKYYLSVKLALVLVFILPIILDIPLPFSPIQIIVLELFMDLAASAGFVAEPAEKNIFTRPPRNPKEKFINAKFLKNLSLASLSLFITVTATYLIALDLKLPLAQAQTMAFIAWLIGHIFLAFTSRSDDETIISLKPFSNKLMNLWALATFVFLFILMLIPQLGSYFKLTPISAALFFIPLVISIVAIFWRELLKIVKLKK
jgi:P-type Ca2+ transporter type 2C